MQKFFPVIRADGEENKMKQAMDKISVIIPVFNVEIYLGKCIVSVLEQTHTNIELILIDDGSTDGSGAFCDKFALKDSRVKVLHIKNGGVSRARNMGIENATGKWICFIDSDDWIEKTMLEDLLKSAKKFKTKMACCYFDEDREGHTVHRFSEKQNYCAEACEIAESFCVNSEIKSVMYPPWNKLFDAEYARKLCFHNDLRIGEDFLFCLQFIAGTGKMAVVTKSLYHYRIRQGSTMQEKFSDKKLDYLKAADRVVDVYEQFFPEYKTIAEVWRYVHTLNTCRTIYKSGLVSDYICFLQKSDDYLTEKKGAVWKYLTMIQKGRMLCYFADRIVYDMRRIGEKLRGRGQR